MKNITIKKIFAVIAVCTLILTIFAGCAKKEEPVANVPNPLTEVTPDKLTITLTQPDGATDVYFYTLDDGSENIVNQMTFTYGGVEYTYRAQDTNAMEAYDMSGLNYDKWDTAETTVGTCKAIVETNDEAAAIYWIDIVPGINYTLGCTGLVSADDITALANTIFVPAQGNADGDEETYTPVETVDFTGEYEDGNYDTVALTLNEDGTYAIEIGIYRLTSFTAEGTVIDGAVEFTVTDSDSTISGTFFEAEDASYTLIFTQSDWDLLEEGTTFEGFSLNK